MSCRRNPKRSLVAVVACCATLCAHAQSPADMGDTRGKGSVGPSGKFVPNPVPAKPDERKQTPEQARENLKKALKLEDLGNGKYRVGSVTLDKKARTVSFPVKVNMTEGVVEYVLVTENGKAHESVFTTAASPTHIHLACVLLDMVQADAKSWPKDHTSIPKASSLIVEVTWPTNGPHKRLPLNAFIVKAGDGENTGKKLQLEAGGWFYSGSHFHSGSFAAQREGSIISIIGDSSALVNGLRKGHDNDLLHSANTRTLPKKGRRVTMVLTLPTPSADAR